MVVNLSEWWSTWAHPWYVRMYVDLATYIIIILHHIIPDLQFCTRQCAKTDHISFNKSFVICTYGSSQCIDIIIRLDFSFFLYSNPTQDYIINTLSMMIVLIKNYYLNNEHGWLYMYVRTYVLHNTYYSKVSHIKTY